MQLIIKQFRAWFRQARALHKSSHAVPLVSVGDIWWIAMGDNIGSEINGKNSKHHTEFSRPGIIYKKLSHSLYLIVPTTSGHKEGSWWCNLKFKGKDMAACLHQIRVIDYRRLYDDMGKLSATEFALVERGFLALYENPQYRASSDRASSAAVPPVL
jgi:mRNA-degrading endonuclease toxin of MazEF toxin-antitoxin module